MFVSLCTYTHKHLITTARILCTKILEILITGGAYRPTEMVESASRHRKSETSVSTFFYKTLQIEHHLQEWGKTASNQPSKYSKEQN